MDELAVYQLIEPPGVEPLAEVLQHIPQDQPWSEPQPLLVTAALRLAGPGYATAGVALAAAAEMLDQIPADQEIPSRLALALIQLGLAQREGELHRAEVAAADAADLIGQIPADQLARHPDTGAQVKAARGTVELWAGHFDQAAVTLNAAAAAARNQVAAGRLPRSSGPAGSPAWPAEPRRRAGRAGRPGPAGADQVRAGEYSSCAATVAMAYVHVERNQLAEARQCLRRADESLQLFPHKLIGAIACLVAARGFLAQAARGPGSGAGQPGPAWLDPGPLAGTAPAAG